MMKKRKGIWEERRYLYLDGGTSNVIHFSLKMTVFFFKKKKIISKTLVSVYMPFCATTMIGKMTIVEWMSLFGTLDEANAKTATTPTSSSQAWQVQGNCSTVLSNLHVCSSIYYLQCGALGQSVCKHGQAALLLMQQCIRSRMANIKSLHSNLRSCQTPITLGKLVWSKLAVNVRSWVGFGKQWMDNIKANGHLCSTPL